MTGHDDNAEFPPAFTRRLLDAMREEQQRAQREWEARLSVREFQRQVRAVSLSTLTTPKPEGPIQPPPAPRTYPVARCVACGAEYWRDDRVFDAGENMAPMPRWHRVSGELRHACRGYAGGLSATEAAPDIWRD